MKKYIYMLRKNYQLYAIMLLGLSLILFPTHLVRAVPYLLGEGLLLLAVLNAWFSLKSSDREAARPGRSVFYLGIGIVTLILRTEAIPALGVVWATLILLESADEINEMYHEGEIHIIPLVWTVVSVVLAVMLMHDPEEHFTFHMRILGMEMIAYALIHRTRQTNR